MLFYLVCYWTLFYIINDTLVVEEVMKELESVRCITDGAILPDAKLDLLNVICINKKYFI